ncbi:hypothetical protein, partial [Variovorax rhizosphaerae]
MTYFSSQAGSLQRASRLSLLSLALLAAPFAMAQSAPGADAGVARGVLRAQQEAVLSSSVSERITVSVRAAPLLRCPSRDAACGTALAMRRRPRIRHLRFAG